MSKQTDHLNLIHIPSPCPTDWDSMTGNDVVRFCGHCHLDVHNLSEMTPKAAIKLIANSNGRLCVRYHKRPESAPQPVAQTLHQIGRRASRIAAGVFSATLSLSATVGAQPRSKSSPLIPAGAQLAATREAGRKIRIDGSSASLVGHVIDPVGACVPGARVSLIYDATNSEQVVTSGDEGEFSFQSLSPGTYTITVQSPGFKIAQIQGFNIQAGSEQRFEVKLEVGEVLGGAVEITPPSEPLVRAAMEDDIKALRKLLDDGVNVNVVDESYAMTALEMAAGHGNLEMVELLLWSGADVNTKNPRGHTALMGLSARSTPEVVRALLTAGAKIDLQDDDGDTALMNVASSNNTEVLQVLLDAGASVNVKNRSGQTALMLAAGQGDIDSTKALIAAGANVHEADEKGLTIIESARVNGHDDVVELLRSYGAIDPGDVDY